MGDNLYLEKHLANEKGYNGVFVTFRLGAGRSYQSPQCVGVVC